MKLAQSSFVGRGMSTGRGRSSFVGVGMSIGVISRIVVSSGVGCPLMWVAHLDRLQAANGHHLPLA